MIEKPQLTILLDSNFIMSLARQRREFERELTASIPQKIKIKILDIVILELEHLSRKSPSATRIWAKASLELLAKRNYETVEHKPGPVDVDVTLITYALSEKPATAIATIDRELLRSLKSLEIPRVFPRRGHGLIFEGWS